MTNINFNLDDPEAAAEGARRARTLVTSLLHHEEFSTLFVPTLNDVLNEVKDDPEQCAYLIAALANFGQATVHGLAAEMRIEPAEAMQIIARALDETDGHL